MVPLIYPFKCMTSEPPSCSLMATGALPLKSVFHAYRPHWPAHRGEMCAVLSVLALELCGVERHNRAATTASHLPVHLHLGCKTFSFSMSQLVADSIKIPDTHTHTGMHWPLDIVSQVPILCYVVHSWHSVSIIKQAGHDTFMDQILHHVTY